MDICPSMPLDGLTTAVPGDSAPFSSLPMMADNGGLADAHNPADDTALRALLGDLLQDEQLFSELPELAPHGVGELERGVGADFLLPTDVSLEELFASDTEPLPLELATPPFPMELTTPPLPMELATPHLPQELTTPLLPQELATPSLPLDLSTSPLPPPLASSGRCETALPAPLPPSLPNTSEPQTGGASVVPLVQSDPLSVQSDIAGAAYGNPLELLRPFLTPEYGRSDLHDLSKILLSLTTGFTGYGTNYLTTSALSTESTPFSATTGGNSGSESDVSSDDSDSTGLKNSFDRLQPPRKRRRPSPLHPSPPPTLTVVRGRAKHLQQCVEHDHCYAMTSGQPRGRRSGSEGDVSVEEENSSDPGYETMSAVTSPGNRSTASGCNPVTPSPHSSPAHPSTPPPHPSTPPSTPPAPSSTEIPLSFPPLGTIVDPVALIDARIKHFMCSQQVNLTEEEKETLAAEGLPIPTTLPLTKLEEKALKSVRRKIRNKLAAQESRKRKKDQMQSLEDRVRLYSSENQRLKKKVDSLESDNKSLTAQLHKLQALLGSGTAAVGGTRRSAQVGTCFMVIVLCFAVFLGTGTPQKLWGSTANDYATPTVRSRALLSLDVPQDNLQSTACNWFRYLFGRDSYPARPRPSAPYGPWPQPSAEPSRLSHKTTPTSDRLPLVCSTANTSSDDDSLASHGQCKLLPQPVAT